MIRGPALAPYPVDLSSGAVEADEVATETLVILRSILAGYPRKDFAVRLWNGLGWQPGEGITPKFVLVINEPDSLRRMFLRPNMLSLGRAYVRNDFDFEGDVEAAFHLGDYLLTRPVTLTERFRWGLKLLRLPRGKRKAAAPTGKLKPFSATLAAKRSRSRTSRAVSYHYDLPPEFFEQWLDEKMVYSCAYFASPDEDLESAQRRKLDYLCRKLRLKEGNRLLDVGCGWGALAEHAARCYGVHVVGVTVSQQQADYARRRVARTGMKSRCQIKLLDYRDVNEPKGFDRLVSVGMAEHVREPLLPAYFAHAFSLVRPGGIFVHHAIASSVAVPPRRGPSFMDRYIFPDTELVPIHTTLRIAEASGWEVRDVENLREHYALTLRHWLERFRASRHEIERLTDEKTFRKFQIYLAGCIHDFECGRLNIFQTVLVRPTGHASGLPLTRADLMTEKA